jgi:hypothetical protein
MKKIFLLSVIIFLVSSQSYAQLGEQKKTTFELIKLRLKKAPRILTYGWSVIDDNGKAYINVFSPKSFNTNIVPLTFNYDTYYSNGWFFNIKTSFCNFKSEKIVNNEIIDDPQLLFSLDLNASVSLSSIYNPNYELLKLKKNIIDFRLISGLGYTNRNIYVFDHAMNFNFGGGMYARFSKDFGMNLELMSKFGLKAPLISTNSNYMHATIGFSYFIGAVKFKDPKEKTGAPRLQ